VAIGHRTTKVLILARDSVIAALIGMLLEMEDFEPVFAEPEERPEDALNRLRPPLVIVIDGELEVARSDLFFARAAAAHARVVLFSEPLAADEVRAAARARRCAYFAMPVDRATLGQVLASATAD
jgi:DNA-binding NtrC family response regulator